MQNPALNAFLDRLAIEQVFGQVLVSRSGTGFELRHVEDRTVEGLNRCSVKELRAVAQFTTGGAFRPLKSAPTLRRGWLWAAPDPSALAQALDTLYPGALADWFSAGQRESSVTDFRSFMERQTGMYRTAAMLSGGKSHGRVLRILVLLEASSVDGPRAVAGRTRREERDPLPGTLRAVSRVRAEGDADRAGTWNKRGRCALGLGDHPSGLGCRRWSGGVPGGRCRFGGESPAGALGSGQT
jgi:hypothetical protein